MTQYEARESMSVLPVHQKHGILRNFFACFPEISRATMPDTLTGRVVKLSSFD